MQIAVKELDVFHENMTPISVSVNFMDINLLDFRLNFKRRQIELVYFGICYQNNSMHRGWDGSNKRM